MGIDTRVKICGLRSAGAAVAASDTGADYLGFNFVEGVRRQLQQDEGVRVIADYRSTGDSAKNPGLVGLFRNQSPEFVNETADLAGLDFLQLCGDEDLEYISKVNLPIFKMVWVRKGDTPSDLESTIAPLLDSGHGVLLDSFNKDTPGGSGKSFDWSAAEGIANRENVLLAGGLTPENVQSAIGQLSPWGVDVSSGVEIDGEKDPDRIRAFVDAVRST